MTENLNLGSALYRSMVRQGAARLLEDKQKINDLNVFPIPDGDTGDNMFMTIRSGADSPVHPGGEKLCEAAAAVSSGMLMGARGNSGVILSRIFAGIAKGFEGLEEADLQQFAYAMQCGVKEAYNAVSTPVEGTILTVIREAVEKTPLGESIEAYIEEMTRQMLRSLERTPDLLPVLKEAGVVDSGGAGILCITQGMLDALRGISTDIPEEKLNHGGTPDAADMTRFDKFGPDTPLQFGYCTEFLLRLQNAKTDLSAPVENDIRAYLEDAGESVVCFRDGSIVKVHVHTKTPGEILSHCQRWGEFLTLKIENMTLQHSAVTIRDNFSTDVRSSGLLEAKKPYAVVEVASGEGIVGAMREAGADFVIEGGQTMNPSAESFIRAFEVVRAEMIFVFPNNSNIIMTAGQAASLYDKARVKVIPSKNPVAGLAVLASMDRSCKDIAAVEENALEYMAGIRCATVARASRDSDICSMDIVKGKYIGIDADAVQCCEDSAPKALETLLEKMISKGEADVCLVFASTPESREEAENLALSQWVSKFPRTEFSIMAGGQRVFDYMLILC